MDFSAVDFSAVQDLLSAVDNKTSPCAMVKGSPNSKTTEKRKRRNRRDRSGQTNNKYLSSIIYIKSASEKLVDRNIPMLSHQQSRGSRRNRFPLPLPVGTCENGNDHWKIGEVISPPVPVPASAVARPPDPDRGTREISELGRAIGSTGEGYRASHPNQYDLPGSHLYATVGSR